MNKRKLIIIIGASAAVIIAGALSVYAAWPTILLNFYPDKYVSYAVGNTMKELTILDKSKKFTELYSNIYNSSSTYNFGLTVNNVDVSGFNGTELLSGMGIDASLIVDRDNENAGLDLKFKKSTTPILSAKGYISNSDFGGIVPEIYSKYIVADTNDFAYNWNNSILGSNFQIDERIDIDNLYNIIFPKPAATDEKSIYQKISEILIPYAEKLEYEGKGSVNTRYNGKDENLSRIDVTLSKEDVKQLAEQIIDLFEFGGIDAALYETGKYVDTDMAVNSIEQLRYYIESANLNKDLVIELYFSKNKIAKINSNAEVIGVEDMVFGLSTDMQIVDKVIEADTNLKVFIPSETGNIIDSNCNIVYTLNGQEDNVVLNMTVNSPEIFDASIIIDCVSGFDEKDVSVYTNINKLAVDINYDEEHISANTKLNFSCKAGTGNGVVIPNDAVNITEASQAEVFEIYTEVLSNLDEILMLVNLY